MSALGAKADIAGITLSRSLIGSRADIAVCGAHVGLTQSGHCVAIGGRLNVGNAAFTSYGFQLPVLAMGVLMSRNQRRLLFGVGVSTVVIGLQSFAAAEICPPGKGQCGAAQQGAIRRQILEDEQPKTQKSVVKPKGGSTGPTAPTTPTQGRSHK